AREAGIPVHVAGLGDPYANSVIRVGGEVLRHDGQDVQTRLEEAPLGEIARITGGSYVRALTLALPLGDLYLDKLAAASVCEESEDALPAYRPRYMLFLLPAVGFLAMALAMPDRAARRTVLQGESP